MTEAQATQMIELLTNIDAKLEVIIAAGVIVFVFAIFKATQKFLGMFF